MSFLVKEFKLTQRWGFPPLIVSVFWFGQWTEKSITPQISTAETVLHSSSSKWLATASIANSKTCERRVCVATQCIWSSSCLRRASRIQAGVAGVPFWRLFFLSGLQIFFTVGFFLTFLDLRVITCKSIVFKCGYCIFNFFFWDY